MTSSDNNNQSEMKSPMGTIGAVGVAGLAGALSQKAHALGSGKIKVGLLGCGGRGKGALRHCLQADPGVEVVALADLFESKVRDACDQFGADKKYEGRVKVDAEHLFWGFDCHEQLAKTDADLLLMAEDWAVQQILLDTDLDRNGTVELGDFAILALQWFWREL